MLFDDEPELIWRRFFRKCDRAYPQRQILVRWLGTRESGGDFRDRIGHIVPPKVARDRRIPLLHAHADLRRCSADVFRLRLGMYVRLWPARSDTANDDADGA
jgi:hypothetical protein